jgi:transposase
MQDFLLEEYSLLCSHTTIYDYLRAAKWSRKVVSKHAKERSEKLRQAFWQRTRSWSAEQVVCLDESAANERTGDRKRGWAPIGDECIAHYSIKRSERWSILPAMCLDGYLAYDIYQGGYTSEMFERFLQYDVLPQCNPYPQPRSIIIMDNASIHRGWRVQELCLAAGVHLEYLPPYSPDYNPIEQSFKVLKAWIRKHIWMAETFKNFGQFLNHAVESCETRGARGYYKRCGYVV